MSKRYVRRTTNSRARHVSSLKREAAGAGLAWTSLASPALGTALGINDAVRKTRRTGRALGKVVRDLEADVRRPIRRFQRGVEKLF